MALKRKPVQKADILDPWIIDQIKRREEKERRDDRPVLEIPKEPEYDPERPNEQEIPADEPGSDRGVWEKNFGKRK